jgi:hypothetical protein
MKQGNSYILTALWLFSLILGIGAIIGALLLGALYTGKVLLLVGLLMIVAICTISYERILKASSSGRKKKY